jgi:PTS system ascorbate-specific IIA component
MHTTWLNLRSPQTAVDNTEQILLITHGQIGQSLLETALTIFGENQIPVYCISYQMQNHSTEFVEHLTWLLKDKKTLILVDIYGATPCNIVKKIAEPRNYRLVSGVNLPMLLRVLNYFPADLNQLSHLALAGGRNGIDDNSWHSSCF